MKHQIARLLTCGLLFASALSKPAPLPVLHGDVVERGVTECQIVNFVLVELKGLGAQATSFCSSLLSIPVVTATASSVTTVTPPLMTAFVTSIPPEQTVITTVVTTDVVTTVTVYQPPGAKVKRSNSEARREAIPRPSRLQSFASAQLSTACSCLSIPTSSTTVTVSAATTLVASTVTDTVTGTTITTTVTDVSTLSTTATSTDICATTQAVANGGFESGSLVPFASTGDSVVIENNAANAHSGSYYAQVNVNGAPFQTAVFTLTQSVNVCAGAPYTLKFYSFGQQNTAGDSLCSMSACVGSTCTKFDEPGGIENGGSTYGPTTLNFPGTTGGATSVVISISSDGNYDGGTYCDRAYIKFDDFTLTLA